MQLYKKLLSEGIKQSIVLGLFRSDYMLHAANSKLQLQQVEINTISAAFGNLGPRVNRCHRYLSEATSALQLDASKLPQNDADQRIAAALARAHQIYVDRYNVYARARFFSPCVVDFSFAAIAM